MVYLIFKDNELLNRIVADREFIVPYCAENGYTWEEKPASPPVPQQAEPTPQEDTEALLVDHEYRLTLLELGLGEGVTQDAVPDLEAHD